ncbi:reverse transcriptase [Gossypium australe]|uniref:Reverse transcriptase n=1 Tax=Gossypium australe TaxID=47621 RepID=A0A5B6VTW0_9ROSI|nr:reverse transcriptase [Gossypium australe]
MKIISWNVCGLGNPRAVRRLRYMLKQHNPNLVFFMETKINDKRMERIRKRSGFVNGIDVGAEGSKGGLCLAWREEVNVSLRTFSKSHIDVLIEDNNIRAEWRFTGFYGSPYATDQHASWPLLRELGQEQSFLWLVSGDFNEILYSFEKSGGQPREERRMAAFRETLDACHLMDLGFQGICPRFKFKAWWTLEESFEIEVKKSWESSNGSISEKLERLQTSLTSWASSIKKGIDGLKKKLTKELETLLNNERNNETMARLIDTRIHLNMEIDKDEMYWEQRARVNWLQLGNKNTTFFHKYASARRKVKTINGLEAADGQEVTDESGINEVASKYVQDLFSSKGVGDSSYLLEGIGTNISSEINEMLLSSYSVEEVQKALKEMGPTKAPVLNEDKGFEGTNRTDIVLIPKSPNPTNLINFRPISLCTILFKIVAKTIANRIQDYIGRCIDSAQIAFVPGRLISDDVLIAYEILHTLRQKRYGRKGFIAVKLDMSKAYDRVE